MCKFYTYFNWVFRSKFTTLLFVLIIKPKELLLLARLLNGFILPFALAIMLIGSRKITILKQYTYPIWIQLSGWIVVILMGTMSVFAVIEKIKGE
jgi:Mn2+/Fe2+ NRAMP family transporter